MSGASLSPFLLENVGYGAYKDKSLSLHEFKGGFALIGIERMNDFVR